MDLKKFNNANPRPLSRFFSRVLDYFFFYCFLVLPLFYNSLFDHDYMHLLCIILVPLAWIPFEVLFIWLFGTTPGKAFLGIHLRNKENKKPSFIQSLKRSFSVWFKGIGLNLPLLNVILCVRRLTEMKKKNTLPWDKQLGITILYKKKRKIRTIIAGMLIGFFSLFYVAEYQFREILTSSNQEFFTKKLFNKEKWINYDDKNGAFSVSFLATPEEKKTTLPISKSKDALPYTEIKHLIKEDDVQYELSYTTLPKSLMKWSPNLLLKGSLKIFASSKSGIKILNKSTKRYKNLPALEFIMQKGSTHEKSGRLILIEDTLYKLDVTYPNEKKEELQENIAIFLHSFESKKK
ncbi:hypothetical protein COB11_05610 [Candidatus Aerophobetes bacterium]|uniref:RDD domain-containing protein n=1 Tax=Aerophobetes bacterium TaxID=2030807 RepID=A0A2A4YEG9_UNCAE|nr:MAG: hypothetical protein COB11_05610 [Candidatus Aerophobetes bacterium]